MSADQALPASTALERDAQQASNSHKDSTGHKVAPSEIAIGVVIGRMSEYFDFFVYGIGSVLVFPKVFFPFLEPLYGTLAAFGVFALAFVARPAGSILFMEIGRRHGRGVKLTTALFLLGGSTAAISFLPRYDQIGVAAILMLAAFRIGQGLALGGAWDGLASLLALNAPKDRRGWYAMIPQLGAPLGFMLASSLFAFFLVNISMDDFIDWGWRYPFYVAFAVNVVALFARLRLIATQDFTMLLDQSELNPAPVAEVFAVNGRFILIGAFAPLASFALFHLVTIFPISWIVLYTQRSAGEFLMVQFVGAMVCLATVVVSGLIADRIGRRRLLEVSAGLVALFAIASIVAPILFEETATGQTIYVIVGFALLGLAYGQSAGAATSNFAPRYRYTGAALTSDLAWLIGAGFAPLVALSLSSKFGLACVGVYLLSGAACTLLAMRFNTPETREA
ncbi:MFS transporter [uncultured Methylobacterium sp.]|uniref:MFS transporter n=1 Tax=uncultured Methylobacterium sp. TaxID=157278 RepID=UPI0035CC7913